MRVLAFLALVTLVGCKSDHAFLAIPLAKSETNLTISEGWNYSEDEHKIHPGIPTHFGDDIPRSWGTKVYAPADGLAVSSYHTYEMLDSTGRKIGFGLGLFIAIWHEKQQVYSSYCHFSRINDSLIPYIPPTLENGNWQPRQAIYIPVADFKRKAKPVKRGDLIGCIGYTGLLVRPEIPSNPPQVDPSKDKTWDPHGSHLHWEVYTRTPDGAKKDKRLDPFGIYGDREQYKDVFTHAQGLILADKDGSPVFAHK